ncbi:MAG: hypothetical protein HYY04_11865, partial [Chloroflexi bacterium]|nr:hypothetical protein [Chloroflexota bacterium]
VGLQAARERRPRRLVVLFQPHTFHRRRGVFDDFVGAVSTADRVAVADIYMPAGREQPGADVHAADLVRAMAHPAATYAGSVDAAAELLAPELAAGDLVLTLGAGDIHRAADRLVALLRSRGDAIPPSTLAAHEAHHQDTVGDRFS